MKQINEMTDRELLHTMLDKLLDAPGEEKVIAEFPTGDGNWKRAQLRASVWTISCKERERQLREAGAL